MRWRGLAVVRLLALGLSLASCATQPIPNVHRPPGLLLGRVHGFVALLARTGSMFYDRRIYGFANSGSGYDLRFVVGRAVFHGGAGRLGVARWRATAPA